MGTKQTVTLILLFLCLGVASASAQPAGKQANKPAANSESNAIRSTPAYAAILLRDTELKADLESLLLDYTEDYPKVKEIRSELELLDSEFDRLLAVKPADSHKLTEALGKLILGKVGNQSKLRQLRLQYADDNPSVKRQRKKVEVYEAAIKQILD